MQKEIKTIIIGTPDFGVPAFEALIKSNNFKVTTAITQPNKKIGRKQIISAPPVRELAKKNNIQVYQPTKIKEITNKILDLQPDIIVVIAYAQIIPKIILDIPKYGCINVHASILPKYRGAACIQAALLSNDSETGISIMQMDAGLDTGPIINQKVITIKNTDTAGTLFGKLSKLGGDFIVPTLIKYIQGKLSPTPQDNSKASYVGLLKKSDGKINWNQTALNVFQHQKAMSPWPGAFTKVNINGKEKILKILDIENTIEENKYSTGKLFKHQSKIAIQCANNAILINSLQLEGKKPSTAEEFLHGYSLKNISIL